MKYLMITAFGLSLELSKRQAEKAVAFGKNTYEFEEYFSEGINRQYTFADGDRWIYEIDIFDETHPLD